MSAPLIVYQHTDGRRIEVYADRKIRRGYTTIARGGQLAPLTDQWPILWRRDVPSLTDEEWTAGPEDPAWKAVQP